MSSIQLCYSQIIYNGVKDCVIVINSYAANGDIMNTNRHYLPTHKKIMFYSIYYKKFLSNAINAIVFQALIPLKINYYSFTNIRSSWFSIIQSVLFH